MSVLNSNLYFDSVKNTVKHFINDNRCSQNHLLTWCKSNLIYNENTVCKICHLNFKKNNSHTIRWQCYRCIEYYCIICKPITFQTRCPINHKLTYLHQHNCTFNCDLCQIEKSGKVNIYADTNCNLSFCINCYNKGFDEYEKED